MHSIAFASKPTEYGIQSTDAGPFICHFKHSPDPELIRHGDTGSALVMLAEKRYGLTVGASTGSRAKTRTACARRHHQPGNVSGSGLPGMPAIQPHQAAQRRWLQWPPN